MDRPVREKKRPNHYDPAKEAAKPQWKKRKSEKKPVHTYFVSDEATKRSRSRLLLALRPVLRSRLLITGRFILTSRIAPKFSLLNSVLFEINKF
jgi:hypothetical protein